MHFISNILFALILVAQSCNTSNKSLATIDDKPATQTNKETYPLADYIQSNSLENASVAIFAGGCFWCTEAVYERIEGVTDVISGYAGGDQDYPSYYEVGAGKTGHAEAIAIFYDTTVVDYKTLLEVFFVAHDPTTLNRQGPDVGSEYRSAIYYNSDKEREIINNLISETDNKKLYDDPIVTEVEPYQEFWVAEGYHQNYYELNPNHGYVVRVSRPKVEKVKKVFPSLIKKKYRS